MSDDVMGEENGEVTLLDVQEAVMKAAVGGRYVSKKVAKKANANGTTSQDTAVVSRNVPPNPALLMHVLSNRIGGEQDWC